MIQKPNDRLCIFAQDIALITGRSYKTSLRIMREIKKAYSKPKNSLITYMEFCSYMNLDEAEVLERLK